MPKRAEPYVILQGDYYWRPDGAGYTANLFEAGIFTKEFALKQQALKRDPLDEALRVRDVLSRKGRYLNSGILKAALNYLENTSGGKHE